MPDGTLLPPSRLVDATSALRIAGLIRLTTIDYPGELAAVIFCQGCPWRCRYCHNQHLLETEAAELLPWSEVMGFLQRRRGLLDAVVVSGGEPTAQTALGAAMREIRELGYKIGLHTNGAYPERLRELLSLIDWVGLDIKALPEDYPAITGVSGSGELAWSSLQILLESKVDLEVRTTLMPTWTPEYIQTLSQRLADAGVQNYALQVCTIARARDPALPAYTTPPQALMAAVDPQNFSHLERRGF